MTVQVQDGGFHREYDRFVFRHKDPHLDPLDYQYYGRCVDRFRKLESPLFVLHRTGLTDRLQWSFRTCQI